MHKPSAVLQLERRLADLGCPARERERRARELAEHYQDLKQASLEEGLSEAAAEARANELLGEPVSLAEQLAGVLRQSSWWGRHRIIGFCFLPPPGIFAASILSLFAVLGCLRVCFSANEWRVLADQGPGFRLLVLGVERSQVGVGIAEQRAADCAGDEDAVLLAPQELSRCTLQLRGNPDVAAVEKGANV